MTRPAHARTREERTCAGPGCDEPMTGRRSGALYHSDACRARAWKQSVGYGPQRTVRTDMRGGSRAPDLRISYRKTVDVVANALEEVGFLLEPSGPHDMRDMAEAWLRPLLTERQRAALDQREVKT